jgi:hypothetical protein
MALNRGWRSVPQISVRITNREAAAVNFFSKTPERAKKHNRRFAAAEPAYQHPSSANFVNSRKGFGDSGKKLIACLFFFGILSHLIAV